MSQSVPRAHACMLQSNSRYVMHGHSFEFRIRKNNFIKFLISLIRKNKVKYKFPGIRYNIIIVTNALLLFLKRHKPVSHYYLIKYGSLLLCREKILLGLNFANFSKPQYRERSRLR